MISKENYNELLRFRDSPVPYEGLPSERLTILHRFGWVRLETQRWSEITDGVETEYIKSYWVITELGKDALSEFEHIRNKETEDERQKRFQNKISVAQVFVPLVTFVLGLFVEYFSGIINWFSRLIG